MHSIIKHRMGTREDGFTLIELLVVVIVVGILAAVAFPIYFLGQQGSKDSGAQSDLAHAKTAVVGYWTARGAAAATPTFDADATTGLAKYGYTLSSASTASVAFKSGTTPSMKSFCIQAVGTTSNTFHITESDGVAAGGC